MENAATHAVALKKKPASAKMKPETAKKPSSKPSATAPVGDEDETVVSTGPAPKNRSPYIRIHGETHIREDLFKDLVGVYVDEHPSMNGHKKIILTFDKNGQAPISTTVVETDLIKVGKRIRDFAKKYLRNGNASEGDDIDSEMERHENGDIEEAAPVAKKQKVVKEKTKSKPKAKTIVGKEIEEEIEEILEDMGSDASDVEEEEHPVPK